MRDKFKYIIALLLSVTLSTMFMPILNVGGIKISLFDIVKIRFADCGNSTFESFLADSLEKYAYFVILILVITVFDIIWILVVKAEKAYIYTITNGIVNNIIVYVGYGKIADKLKGLETAFSFWGQGDYFYLCKTPIIIWGLCYVAAMALAIIGIVSLKTSDKSGMSNEIIPEEFFFEKNPWESRRRKEVNREKAESTLEFNGGIKGVQGAFKGKIYPMESLMPVYFVKKDNNIFLMQYDLVKENLKNYMLDEVLAEIYYIPQYEEYFLKPSEKLKIFLESGQPLGKERAYYLPRETAIYCEEKYQKFILA